MNVLLNIKLCGKPEGGVLLPYGITLFSNLIGNVSEYCLFYNLMNEEMIELFFLEKYGILNSIYENEENTKLPLVLCLLIE